MPDERNESEYPRTLTAVCTGRRLMEKDAVIHAYQEVLDTRAGGETMYFTLKKAYHGVGTLVELVESKPGSYLLASAKRIGYYEHREEIQKWQSLDGTVEAAKAAQKLLDNDKIENTMEVALQPIIKALREANEVQKTAIIGAVNRRLIRAMLFGK